MLGEVLTAVLTPFSADGSVNYEAFKRLCTHLVDTGSDGVVVAGTTGESPTLTDDERFGLFTAAVEAVGDRASVVAGTGTYSTAHSVHLTREAHGIGVDAFLVVTPYYSKPPARGIVAHFEAIAAVTDKPIVVYNIPQRVVVNIEPDTLTELAEIPNVQYVKQATPGYRPGEADRERERPDPLRGQRRPSPAVPRGRRERRHLRLHAPRRPARARACHPLPRRRRRRSP